MEYSFGKKLEELIKARGISARQLAKTLDLPARTVDAWVGEGGAWPRDPGHLKKLAIFFDMSVHSLLYGDEDERGLISELIRRRDVFSGTFEIQIKRVRLLGDKEQ